MITLTQDDPSSQNTRKKVVSFKRTASVRRTLSRHQYTLEEFEAAWYTSEEIQITETDLRLTVLVSQAETLIPEENDDFTMRGLESHLPEGQALKALHREATRNAVFYEQELQRSTGQYNPQVIVDSYSDLAHESVALARRRGISDERTVQDILRHEDDAKRKIKSSPKMDLPPRIPVKRPSVQLFGSNSLGAMLRRRSSAFTEFQRKRDRSLLE